MLPGGIKRKINQKLRIDQRESTVARRTIRSALQQSMADGFKPTLAIVFT